MRAYASVSPSIFTFDLVRLKVQSSFLFWYLINIHIKQGCLLTTQATIFLLISQLSSISESNVGVGLTYKLASPNQRLLFFKKNRLTLKFNNIGVGLVFLPYCLIKFNGVLSLLAFFKKRDWKRQVITEFHGLPAFEVLSFFEKKLPITYMIQYQALDRKLRKIVKNRYRYVRRYILVRPRDRLRSGLRLFKTSTLLVSSNQWKQRLYLSLYALYQFPQTAVVLQLRRRHQQITLRALGLK